MKKYSVLFFCLLFMDCNSQNKKAGNENRIKNDSLNNIQEHIILEDYPSLKKNDSLLHIEYWGEKTDHYAIIAEAVCKKWGFEIWPVGDCESTKEERNKMIKNNIQFNETMKLKYGKDWKERFNKESKNPIEHFLILE